MLVAAAFANAGDADKVARALSRYGLRALPAISGAQLLPPSIPMLMMAAGETSLPGVERLPRRSLCSPPAAEPRHEHRLHPAHRRPSGARRVPNKISGRLLASGKRSLFHLVRSLRLIVLHALVAGIIALGVLANAPRLQVIQIAAAKRTERCAGVKGLHAGLVVAHAQSLPFLCLIRL